jgi:DNA-binding transcriptional LysR family regulator
MDLRHLRYFLCVAEEMHFGRAASRLGISQPPLSQQIRALEEELGVQLFERTSRRVRLTRAGQLFEPEARKTLAQAERAAQTARKAHRGEIGHLGLGIISSGPFVPKVANALYRFRQAHPNVELTLHELGRDDQIAAAQQDRIDIGIIRGFEPPTLPADFTIDCLLEERMVLALRDDHPLAQREADLAISDLRGEPLVLYGAAGGAGFNEHFFALCKDAGFQPVVIHEANGLATLLGLIAAGFGASILAQSLVRLHVDNLVYRPLSPSVISRLWMIHKRDLSPTARAFKDMMDASEPILA